MKALNKKLTTKQGALILAIGGLLLVTLTLSILQGHLGTKENRFSGDNGKVNVGVIENGKGPYETGDGLELDRIGNEFVEKVVSIKNIDKVDYPTTDTYVRVRLVPAFVYDSGDHAGEVAAVNIDPNKIVYDYSSAYEAGDWQAKEIDGETYYFYKKALAPDAVSEALIYGVKYLDTVPENTHFELEVLVDGISASNDDKKFSNAIQAWELSSPDDDNLFSNEVKKK